MEEQQTSTNEGRRKQWAWTKNKITRLTKNTLQSWRTKKQWARRKTKFGDGETTNRSLPLLEPFPLRFL